jgi:hypothetical protein
MELITSIEDSILLGLGIFCKKVLRMLDGCSTVTQHNHVVCDSCLELRISDWHMFEEHTVNCWLPIHCRFNLDRQSPNRPDTLHLYFLQPVVYHVSEVYNTTINYKPILTCLIIWLFYFHPTTCFNLSRALRVFYKLNMSLLDY